MDVSIKLVGPFSIDRFKQAVRQYPSGTRVREIIDELRIPLPLLGIVLVNGLHASVEDLIDDGDTVCLLPFIDGG